MSRSRSCSLVVERTQYPRERVDWSLRRSELRGGTARPLRAALRESPGVSRLAVVRFAGQFGDGMFQAALSGAILFNPERQTDPLAIAAGFVVLLLPYSLIGPYAGALLDRWDRRAVLLVANVFRAALIGVVSAGLLAGMGETPLLLLALAVVGISRFVLAGVSAALPRVLARAWLVPMNAVFTTVAAGCAGLGAATSVAVIGLIGAGDFASAVAVALSGAGSVLGAVLAAGFRPRVLGPAAEAKPGENTVHAIAWACARAPRLPGNRYRSPRRCWASAHTGSCSA